MLKKRSAQNLSFQEAFDRMMEAHEKALHHLNLSIRNARLHRADVYDFVSNYVVCQEQHHNDFVAALGKRGKKLDEALDDMFRPFETIAETRREIVAAIKGGITRKQFAEQGCLPFLTQKHHKKRIPALVSGSSDLDLPPEQPGMTVEQIAERRQLIICSLRDRLSALEARYKRLADLHRALRRDVALTLEQNRRLMKANGQTPEEGKQA